MKCLLGLRGMNYRRSEEQGRKCDRIEIILAGLWVCSPENGEMDRILKRII
jgi:hypothetical protein